MKTKLRQILAAVIFLTALFAFSFRSAAAAFFAHLQVGPILAGAIQSLRYSAEGTIKHWTVALPILAAIFLLTCIFGRFYCSILCPFGILQDIINAVIRRKSPGPEKNLRWMRYAIAAIAFGTAIGGTNVVFHLLDPYTNFGRIASAASFWCAISFAAIVILTIWKRRIFCTAICPIGTILGLLAKHSYFKMKIGSKCIKCGACVRACPAGCIELLHKEVDNERCLRCMKCLSACKVGGMQYTHATSGSTSQTEAPVDASRRALLINGSITLAGLAGGVVLGKTNILLPKSDKLTILPPGASDLARFDAICTGCQLCVSSCPRHILKPDYERGARIFIDLTDSSCDYGCRKCSQICPTGAIPKLSLPQKQSIRIAQASYDATTCRVLQDSEACCLCAKACPAGAITIRKTRTGFEIPLFNPNKCIGCGACQAACPTTPKSFTVTRIEKQVALPPDQAEEQ